MADDAAGPNPFLEELGAAALSFMEAGVAMGQAEELKHRYEQRATELHPELWAIASDVRTVPLANGASLQVPGQVAVFNQFYYVEYYDALATLHRHLPADWLGSWLVRAGRQRRLLQVVVQYKPQWAKCSDTLFQALSTLAELLRQHPTSAYCVDVLRRYALLMGSLYLRLRQRQSETPQEEGTTVILDLLLKTEAGAWAAPLLQVEPCDAPALYRAVIERLPAADQLAGLLPQLCLGPAVVHAGLTEDDVQRLVLQPVATVLGRPPHPGDAAFYVMAAHLVVSVLQPRPNLAFEGLRLLLRLPQFMPGVANALRTVPLDALSAQEAMTLFRLLLHRSETAEVDVDVPQAARYVWEYLIPSAAVVSRPALVPSLSFPLLALWAGLAERLYGHGDYGGCQAVVRQLLCLAMLVDGSAWKGDEPPVPLGTSPRHVPPTVAWAATVDSPVAVSQKRLGRMRSDIGTLLRDLCCPCPGVATMVVHAVLEYLPQALAVLPLEDILKLVSHTPFMLEDLGQSFLPEPPEAEDADQQLSCELLALLLRCWAPLSSVGAGDTPYLRRVAPRYGSGVTADLLLDPEVSAKAAIGRLLVEKVDWQSQPVERRLELLELLLAVVRGTTAYVQAFQLQEGRAPDPTLAKAAKTATNFLGWAADVLEYNHLSHPPEATETQLIRFLDDVFGGKADGDVGLGFAIGLALALAAGDRRIRTVKEAGGDVVAAFEEASTQFGYMTGLTRFHKRRRDFLGVFCQYIDLLQLLPQDAQLKSAFEVASLWATFTGPDVGQAMGSISAWMGGLVAEKSPLVPVVAVMLAWGAHTNRAVVQLLDVLVQLQFRDHQDVVTLARLLRISGATPDPAAIIASCQANHFWATYLYVQSAGLVVDPDADADAQAKADGRLGLLLECCEVMHRTGAHVVALLLWQEVFRGWRAELGPAAGASISPATRERCTTLWLTATTALENEPLALELYNAFTTFDPAMWPGASLEFVAANSGRLTPRLVAAMNLPESQPAGTRRAATYYNIHNHQEARDDLRVTIQDQRWQSQAIAQATSLVPEPAPAPRAVFEALLQEIRQMEGTMAGAAHPDMVSLTLALDTVQGAGAAVHEAWAKHVHLDVEYVLATQGMWVTVTKQTPAMERRSGASVTISPQLASPDMHSLLAANRTLAGDVQATFPGSIENLSDALLHLHLLADKAQQLYAAEELDNELLQTFALRALALLLDPDSSAVPASLWADVATLVSALLRALREAALAQGLPAYSQLQGLLLQCLLAALPSKPRPRLPLPPANPQIVEARSTPRTFAPFRADFAWPAAAPPPAAAAAAPPDPFAPPPAAGVPPPVSGPYMAEVERLMRPAGDDGGKPPLRRLGLADLVDGRFAEPRRPVLFELLDPTPLLHKAGLELYLMLLVTLAHTESGLSSDELQALAGRFAVQQLFQFVTAHCDRPRKSSHGKERVTSPVDDEEDEDWPAVPPCDVLETEGVAATVPGAAASSSSTSSSSSGGARDGAASPAAAERPLHMSQAAVVESLFGVAPALLRRPGLCAFGLELLRHCVALDVALMSRALRTVLAAVPDQPLGLGGWADRLPPPAAPTGPQVEEWLGVVLGEFPPACEEPGSVACLQWAAQGLQSPAYLALLADPLALERLGELLQRLVQRKLTETCCQLLAESLTIFATTAPKAVDMLWEVFCAAMASGEAAARALAMALLQRLDWSGATFHHRPTGLRQLWDRLADQNTQRETVALLQRLPWAFLADLQDEALTSERAALFLRLLCRLHLLPDAPDVRTLLRSVPPPPLPAGQPPFDGEAKDAAAGHFTHPLWLYIRPEHFLACFDGTVSSQALTQAMVHSENLRKLTANLHTLCVVSHRLKDRRVATQVVLETRGVMFTVVVDAQHQFYHLPLAEHLTLLQSILLPIAVQYGADCPPILGTVLWCLSNTDPTCFVKNQVRTPFLLGPGAVKGDLQARFQSPEYVQKYNTIKALVLRFCASASEGLARQLLNTAALLVSDLLLACDVLERAVEAFLRSCKPGSRGCTVAAATLSLPPQYNAQDFLHLCRDRQSNLLVLTLLRQALPEASRATEAPESSFQARKPADPTFSLDDEEPSPTPTSAASSRSSSAPAPRLLKTLTYVVDEALQVLPNAEREWDLLAIYCLVVEVLQEAQWDLQNRQVQARTTAVLEALGTLGGSQARLMDRLTFGLKRHPLASHRFSKEMAFANAALEVYALQVVRRQIVFLPKSMAERVADTTITRKLQDLEQRVFDLQLCQPVLQQLRADHSLAPAEDLPRLMHALQRLLGAGCLLHKV